MLEVHFFFKQFELVVFVIYIVLNSQLRRKEVQRTIIKEIAQRKPNMHFILIDDFNHIMQPSIDKSSRINSNYKKLLLHS